MLRRMTMLCVVTCALLLLSAVPAMAQRGGGGAGGAGGGRRGGGNFDPAARMNNTLDYIQQQLAATDQEWSVLKPKVETVVTAHDEVQSGQGGRGGARGGGRRGGGGGFGGAPTANNAVAAALAALQTTLADPNATAEQISQRLGALRDAKAKAATTLAAAQKDLQSLLTARQEAVLVTMGYLE